MVPGSTISSTLSHRFDVPIKHLPNAIPHNRTPLPHTHSPHYSAHRRNVGCGYA
ncbi:hypothetical protein K493DRAFT_315975 [Basidiobolus meristosporus CBS 931.73]|uniref:Uncharacterized protein n=1 Tax=Basidiobolus meristosporus CBS 931.73 TaxID=1314790 RepID=A0A1Y1Y6I7_9FUNG|nr:hypothetical protein K493DRAFT_315975 [Basidiobolus meristosporus CBS 931.73]|eukprot:ORX93505.1 hypothetical protein K493DRAFT_315975 [Basidiobolus meristosporus CBS 931.73]